MSDDFKESIKKINETYNNIRDDQKDLQALMEDIMKSIKFQEAQQKKAKASLASSIALGAFGVVGSILTCNGTSLMYGISTVANAISAVSNGVNIIWSQDIIKKLNDILEKALNLNQEIQDEIDKLIKELILK